MSFVNTVDIVGDEALTNSIIDRSIVGIVDSNVKTIQNSAFSDCDQLKTVVFHEVTTIRNNAFRRCSALTTADFGKVNEVYASVFNECSVLTALIFRTNAVVGVDGYGQVNSTPIASGTGYIYVPRALVERYKTAARWGDYPNQIRALEDYTVDGTTTGALDESKI